MKPGYKSFHVFVAVPSFLYVGTLLFILLGAKYVHFVFLSPAYGFPSTHYRQTFGLTLYLPLTP